MALERRRRASSIMRQRIPATLLDGRRVELRPICADDRAKVLGWVERLSDEVQALRLGAADCDVCEENIASMVEIDYYDRFAWVAESLEDDGQPVVAVAWYERVEQATAEIQLGVIDEYQSVGLGTMLLFVLAESAIENHIERLRARFDSANGRIARLLDKLGVRPTVVNGVSVAEVRLPLSATQQAPRTP